MTDEIGIRYHNGRYWNEKESEQPPDRYWDGELKNGIPHGTGTYYVPNGATYVGTYKNGKRHGKGTFNWSVDGDNDSPDSRKEYTGKYKNNRFNGLGKMTWCDGRTYEGGFKDGHENGKGTITYPDGKIVEGEFRYGVMNGRGAKTWNAENTQRNKVRDQTSKLKG